MITKKCLICGKKFNVIKARENTAKFCSHSCLGKSNKGRKLSDKARVNISNAKIGEKNPMWKGDNVGYTALHNYVKKIFPKPSLCEYCKKFPPYDLANKGIYNREIENWEWLCRKCHMNNDGRIDYLKINSSRKGEVNGNSKLTKYDVINIKKLFKNNVSNKDIANIYKVNPLTIWEIRTNKRWIHIKI